jgi:hypothetical protein
MFVALVSAKTRPALPNISAQNLLIGLPIAAQVKGFLQCKTNAQSSRSLFLRWTRGSVIGGGPVVGSSLCLSFMSSLADGLVIWEWGEVGRNLCRSTTGFRISLAIPVFAGLISAFRGVLLASAVAGANLCCLLRWRASRAMSVASALSGSARPHCDCLPRHDPQSIAPGGRL